MPVTRLAVLRSGYATLGLAFLALAASVAVPSLVLPALLAALVGGILLAFSDDELPKWAGIVLVTYFALVLLAFLAATPITIDKGEGYFVNSAPPALANDIVYWMGLLSPLILSGVGILAAWEREKAPRTLLIGALAGFLLVAGLTITLDTDVDPDCAVTQNASTANAECFAAAQNAANELKERGRMLSYLSALSAGVAAVGALWAASRPDEYA